METRMQQNFKINTLTSPIVLKPPVLNRNKNCKFARKNTDTIGKNPRSNIDFTL